MQIIERVELTSGAASVTFSSIPNSFTDLMILVSARFDNQSGSAAALPMYVTFNGTAYNAARRQLFGSGSSATSFSGTDGESGNIPTTVATSNTFGSAQIYIPNYTSSNNKSFSADIVSENNATQATQEILAGLWSNNAAITSVTLDAFSTFNFVSGSSFTLYGILKGSSGGVTVS